MANSSDTYWDVDGVSLQTLAYNIVTLGGDRMAPPGFRGSNRVIPFMPGQQYVPKIVDARGMSLGMWVTGADEDGFVPNGTDGDVFQKNFRLLRNLLWTPGRQFTLTKRFRVFGSNALVVCATKGEYVSGLNPSMNGRQRATMTVEIGMTDPYFYQSQIEQTFTSAVKSKTFTVAGDVETLRTEVEFTGPLTNPRMTIGNTWVQLDRVLATGEKAVLVTDDQSKTKSFTATITPVSGPAHGASGWVSNGGHRFWMPVPVGEITATLSSASGTGSAKLRYNPAWL